MGKREKRKKFERKMKYGRNEYKNRKRLRTHNALHRHSRVEPQRRAHHRLHHHMRDPHADGHRVVLGSDQEGKITRILYSHLHLHLGGAADVSMANPLNAGGVLAEVEFGDANGRVGGKERVDDGVQCCVQYLRMCDEGK